MLKKNNRIISYIFMFENILKIAKLFEKIAFKAIAQETSKDISINPIVIDKRGLSAKQVIESLRMNMDSMREESMQYLRSGGASRVPIRIRWYDETKSYHLVDGRHRITFAMDNGATHIPFEFAII